ncbi:MAG: GrxA family glutaredoxin [Pseudomonadales bacterium]|jgi:glutaredoxin 1|uniref:GrxA family glutaredoxin n=1 Tax=uncultured Umboniibacter sp. TaxID=1798917 RepID=UPI00260CF36C|nr:GrxA family glutaredoxin [uncultured Umboniibacter sp.]
METFTIFGRKGCGFCVRAKELCELRGFPFRYIDIHEEGITKADLEKTIGKPVLTVPQVFHGENHIGGFTELDAYVKDQGL